MVAFGRKGRVRERRQSVKQRAISLWSRLYVHRADARVCGAFNPIERLLGGMDA
jgi:hypothetical protein